MLTGRDMDNEIDVVSQPYEFFFSCFRDSVFDVIYPVPDSHNSIYILYSDVFDILPIRNGSQCLFDIKIFFCKFEFKEH